MNIAFGLRLNQNIQTLILDSCYLEDDDVSQILNAVEGHPSLRHLSLQRNRVIHKVWQQLRHYYIKISYNISI